MRRCHKNFLCHMRERDRERKDSLAEERERGERKNFLLSTPLTCAQACDQESEGGNEGSS